MASGYEALLGSTAGAAAVRWALSVLPQSEPPRVSLVAPSAGSRRYARIAAGPDRFVVVWGTDPEERRRFCSWQEILRNNRVRVPDIHAHDPAAGWMLLSDGGTPELLESAGRASAEPTSLLFNATHQLRRFHAIRLEDVPLNAPGLRNALDVFEDLVMQAETASESDRTSFRALASWLVQVLQSSPSGLVHGDFHARNVLFTHRRATVVDFQDAHVGPLYVDVAAFAADHNLRRATDEILQVGALYAAGSPTGSVDLERVFPAAVIYWHCRLLGRLAELRGQYCAVSTEAHNAIHYLTLASTWRSLAPWVREAAGTAALAASRYWAGH
jgi:aminoglycoside/choline kinase family phosphotransferase